MPALRPIRILLAALLSLVLASSAVAGKLDRLEAAERDHYRALKVWMDTKERKQFLKLKTREERDAWLKAQGYWDRFYQYDGPQRRLILDGDVKIGWSEDMVLMAWGPAYTRRREILQDAARAETLVFRFEINEDNEVLIFTPGSTTYHTAKKLFRMNVLIADGKVRSLTKQDGW